MRTDERWYEQDIRGLARELGLKNHRLNLHCNVTVDLDSDGNRYRTIGILNAVQHCLDNSIKLRELKIDPTCLDAEYIDFLIIPMPGDAKGQILFEIIGGGPRDQTWLELCRTQLGRTEQVVMVWASKTTGAKFFCPLAMDRVMTAQYKMGCVEESCRLQDYISLLCFGNESRQGRTPNSVPVPQSMKRMSWTVINHEELIHRYPIPEGWAVDPAKLTIPEDRATHSTPASYLSKKTVSYYSPRRHPVDITPDITKPIQLGDFVVYGDTHLEKLATFRAPKAKASQPALLPPQEQQRSN